MEATSSAHSIVNIRPLFIDFDAHTDGDADFKKELIRLMIGDIWELYHAQHNGREAFLKISHKIKATLEILNDKDLNNVIEQLPDALTQPGGWNEGVQLFQLLCLDVVRSLEKEAD